MPETVYKYHGLGNDFVVMDRRRSGEDLDVASSVWLCDRRRGIGADGVLVLLPAREAWARMVVHNADGSIAEMCGNGLRCAVKYLVDHADQKPSQVAVQTGAGLLSCAISYKDGLADVIEVAMGPARLRDRHLPSSAGGAFVGQPVPGHPELTGTAVSMGNPHLVLFDVPLERAGQLGEQLEHLSIFPERTNVELVRDVSGGFDVVVWERGCGLTQACGTGACAVVAAAVHQGRVPADTWIPVHLPGGGLEVKVARDLSQVLLRGPASFVFEAQLPSSTPPRQG